MKKRQKPIIKTDKKRRHPEERDDEIWLCNLESIRNFKLIGWETKRVGDIAYKDDNITPVENSEMCPVFIKRAELQAKREEYIAKKKTSPGWLKKLLEL